MATELATIAPQMLAFRSIDEIEQFAKIIATSPFVPKTFEGKPGSVVAAIMYGLELGITPMSALQNIAVINGKASVYGDLLLAMCLAHPSTEYIKEAPVDEIKSTKVAWCEAKRKGRDAVRYSFSMEDAQRAKLADKDIWKAYPWRMLQMRPRGFCLRDVYADVLKGLITREEAQDYIDVTPTPSPVQELQAMAVPGAVPSAAVVSSASVGGPAATTTAPASETTSGGTGTTPEKSKPEQRKPELMSTTYVNDHGQDITKEVEESREKLEAEKSRKPTEKLNQQECIFRLQDEMKRLTGTGQDPASKQHRTNVLTSVFGEAIDTFSKASQLGKSALQRGLVKLAAMEPTPPAVPTHASGAAMPSQEDASVSGKEDSPTSPPSDGNPQESLSLPLGEIQTVGSTPSANGEPVALCSAFQDGVRCTKPSMHEGAHAFTPEPIEQPSAPTIVDGYVSVPDNNALEAWAQHHGQADVYADMTASCPKEDGEILVTPKLWGRIVNAVVWAAEHAEVKA